MKRRSTDKNGNLLHEDRMSLPVIESCPSQTVVLVMIRAVGRDPTFGAAPGM